MKFYKRFPGDITIKTGDLSLTEFGAYDRLLDHYYAKETPIDPKKVYTVTRCQTAADRRAVDSVLLEYWTLTQLGWVQQRADEMIAEAQPKIAAARENGKKGGRPSKDQQARLDAFKEPSGLFLGTQEEPDEKTSQSQNQNGSEAKASGDAEAPPAVDNSEAKTETERQRLWREGGTLLVARGMEARDARSLLGRLAKDFKEVIREAVDAAIKAEPADPASYLVTTCQKLSRELTQSVTVPGESTKAYLARVAMESAAEAARQLPTPQEIAAIKAKHKAGEHA